ncbi:uncharacterized protein LOC141905581 isoform X2 [Tubulanus polymorphus]
MDMNVTKNDAVNGESYRKWYHRQDVWVWVAGMLFVIGLSGAIFGIGNAKGWYAPSGYVHNVSVTSQERFWPEPFVEEPGVHGRYGSGRTGRWYYWKLPPDRVTVFTQFFIWACYISHQVFMWTVIYIAQLKKAHSTGPRYSSKLGIFNWVAFGGTMFFHLLHLLQTHTTYDPLAQDVVITSSQGSVIMLIVYVVLIEYRDRGLLFGWPTKRNTDKVSSTLRLSYGPLYVARKYHGYAFSWAAIYTFWYHPMENTWGHVMGFVHTWMIMLQGSLMYTDFHLHKWWRFIVETWVTLHGAVVAYQTGGPIVMWPMFLFGFLLLVCTTQIFSLRFWWDIPSGFRAIPIVLYAGAALAVYGLVPDHNGKTFSRIYEIFFIPAILLLLPLLCHVLFLMCLKIESLCQRVSDNTVGESSPVVQKTPPTAAATTSKVSTVRRVVFTLAALLVLVAFIIVGWLIEYLDSPGELFIWMNILSALYSVGVVLFAMFMKQAIPLDIPVVPLNGLTPNTRTTSS